MERFETALQRIKDLVREVADTASKEGFRNGVRAARTQPGVSTEELLKRIEQTEKEETKK